MRRGLAEFRVDLELLCAWKADPGVHVMRARVDIEVWGELAERAAAELAKGTQVQARSPIKVPVYLPGEETGVLTSALVIPLCRHSVVLGGKTLGVRAGAGARARGRVAGPNHAAEAARQQDRGGHAGPRAPIQRGRRAPARHPHGAGCLPGSGLEGRACTVPDFQLGGARPHKHTCNDAGGLGSGSHTCALADSAGLSGTMMTATMLTSTAVCRAAA